MNEQRSDYAGGVDIVERAKNWAADAKTAHVYGVAVRVDLSTIGMVNELIAEVEHLTQEGKQ